MSQQPGDTKANSGVRQRLPSQPGIGSFLKRGRFDTWAAAVTHLAEWSVTARDAGHESRSLAAWICVSQQITVKLATRSYWKHLTPRGTAREALSRLDDTDDLRCIVSCAGTSDSTLLRALLDWIERDTAATLPQPSRAMPPLDHREFEAAANDIE